MMERSLSDPQIPGYSLAKYLLIILQAFLITSCSTIRNSHKYQLTDDYYEFRQNGTKYQNTFVHIEDDTIRIVSHRNQNKNVTYIPNADQFFLKRSFDVDIMTVGFKYRPGAYNLPRQLNTDFNGNVFVGYRLDRFAIRYNNTPIGITRSYHHRAITIGAFGGIGATAMTPWTTNNRTTDEYTGFILSSGCALMFGVNSLTFGLGVGWDALTDRDKNVWIYQNKPWYGLTVGLNLN